MTRILITGVRGKTGLPLAQRLAARPGVEVLGGSSDPASIAIDGVVPTSFAWDDPSGWGAATDGVGAVYLVRPDRADAPDLVHAGLRRPAVLPRRDRGARTAAVRGRWGDRGVDRRPRHRRRRRADAARRRPPEGFERDELVWTLVRLRDGVFSGVTDTVERVTGRPARSLARCLAGPR